MEGRTPSRRGEIGGLSAAVRSLSIRRQCLRNLLGFADVGIDFVADHAQQALLPWSAHHAYLNGITPSWIAGHVKRPASSRFEYKTKPVPSQARILTRSLRLERNTNKSPQNGSPRSASVTSIAKESIPRRKSTGLVVTKIRRPDRTDIIASSAPLQAPGAAPSCRPDP